MIIQIFFVFSFQVAIFFILTLQFFKSKIKSGCICSSGVNHYLHPEFMWLNEVKAFILLIPQCKRIVIVN